MPSTLTVVAAGLGTLAGEGAVPAEVLTAVEETLGGSGLDATRALATCGVVVVLARHAEGEGAPQVHAHIWKALQAGGAVAAERGLHLAGRDLVADALPSDGLLDAAGPSVAELTHERREAESAVLLLAPGAGVGSFNTAFYRSFADPLNTAGLIRSPSMQAGFVFEVHDLRERRKAVFQAPGEAYSLLAHLGASSRYIVKRIVSGDTGALAVAASTESSAQLLGTPVASDNPLAIVRCQGEFPTLGEVLEPFATPLLAASIGPTARLGPLVPTSIAAAHSRDLPAAPVVALGLQLGETIEGPRDLFADAAFDAARERARMIAQTLQLQGPVEPQRLPLEEGEALPPVAAAALAERWTPINGSAEGSSNGSADR